MVVRIVVMILSLALTLALASAQCVQASSAQRLKDLADIAGVRSNQLVGYGLVVGLNGTGDQTTQTPFTVQTFNNMLREFGIQLPAGTSSQLKNVAAVSVHAELPAFAKPGQRIDVTVSSIGNAKSLRGGTLLVTPLKGLDGRIFAVAQGNLVVGGFGAEGADGSSITVNVPSVGRVPGGANVEVAAPDGFNEGSHIVFNLHRADFTTARRLVEEINAVFGPDVAEPIDSASIAVRSPATRSQRIAFVSELENISITPDDGPARVVINSRTGTIVIGAQVRVSPAAVTHGSLTVSIAESLGVSQPAPFSEGETTVVPESDVEATQETNRMFHFAPGVALQEIVTAVNDVGAAPGDLMAILEALKEAGALQAEIVVI